MRLHQNQDISTQEESLEGKRQARIEVLREKAAPTREFVATTPKRLNCASLCFSSSMGAVSCRQILLMLSRDPVIEELSRRLVAERGVATAHVVEDLDVIEQIGDGLGAGGVARAVHPFVLTSQCLQDLSVSAQIGVFGQPHYAAVIMYTRFKYQTMPKRFHSSRAFLAPRASWSGAFPAPT